MSDTISTAECPKCGHGINQHKFYKCRGVHSHCTCTLSPFDIAEALLTAPRIRFIHSNEYVLTNEQVRGIGEHVLDRLAQRSNRHDRADIAAGDSHKADESTGTARTRRFPLMDEAASEGYGGA